MIRDFTSRPHRRPLPCGGVDDQSCSWRSQLVFATRASRLMSGGMIPASTGRKVVSVGRMHPVIIRIQCNVQLSTILVWVLQHQAGDAYSAALYTRASAPICSVDVYALQLESAIQQRRLFLAFTLLWRLSRCFLYIRDRSRVTPR